MYYSKACPYCSKIFYTFSSNKSQAAETLYHGIKKHMHDYGEEEKEHTLDDGAHSDVKEIYGKLSESENEPSGGYEI